MLCVCTWHETPSLTLHYSGQRFTSRDDKPYCADCFGELFSKRCTSCAKPITGQLSKYDNRFNLTNINCCMIWTYTHEYVVIVYFHSFLMNDFKVPRLFCLFVQTSHHRLSFSWSSFISFMCVTVRYRRHEVHLIRGPPLAQRLLHLLQLQELDGGQGLHHGRRGHHLPRVRQEEADGRHCGAVRAWAWPTLL